MNDALKPGEGDRIERDAKDIVEAGTELGKARARELELDQEGDGLATKIAELQHRQAEIEQEKQQARDLESKDEKRIADDLLDIEQASGHGGGNPAPGKSTVTIVIDTTDFEEPKGKISYSRVVELAYPDFAAFPSATYSILYERGPKANPQGVLSKGGSVEITEGMRFRVKRTGES